MEGRPHILNIWLEGGQEQLEPDFEETQYQIDLLT